VDALVGQRPGERGPEEVPRQGVPDDVRDRPHRRDPVQVGRQPGQRQDRRRDRGTGEGRRERVSEIKFAGPN